MDAELVETESVGQFVAAEHDDQAVVAPVRHERNHRNLPTQRQAHEPLVVAKVDPVAVAPRSIVVLIAAGIDQHGGALIE